MNVVSSRGGHPPLRDEEAAVVERAVRLAVDSVLNVLLSVTGARSRDSQRMVADRDREIRRLEARLTQQERELRLLRCQGCTCGMYGAEPGARGALGALGVLGTLGSRGAEDYDRQEGQQGGPVPGYGEPGYGDPETAAGQQECEMSISVGVFGGPPSHVSSLSLDSAPPPSPGRPLPDRSCSSRASSEVPAPTSPGRPPVKEEPCDVDAVLIKWEMSEERGGGGGGGARSPCQRDESPAGNGTPASGETLRENPEPDPGGGGGAAAAAPRLDLHRNRKRSVPMSELPEEAQRLKRAAWRAASRRYYARKVARQQGAPSRPGAFHHVTPCQYSPPPPPGSFMDRRRATLVSQLPEESQTLQREAWRASSRRYYARKTARHQGAPYGHLPEDADAPERGGAHGGGIACS